jgi:hypothetical protein
MANSPNKTKTVITKQPNIKKVKIEYLKPADYTPKYVTGSIGGPTPKGDILINFFMDISGVPNSQLFNVEEDKLGTEIIEKRLPSIIQNGDTTTLFRQVQSGIILSLNEAKTLSKWLEEQIKIVENQQSKTKK